MAQRLRGLQRGAALLLHHAESATGAQGLLPSCSSASSLLQRLHHDKQYQRNGGSWQQQGWGGGFGIRHASTSSTKAASGAIGAPSDETVTSAADVAPQPEFFPLPESDATEVVSALHQAVEALERATIMGAKADTFFSASWCISGLQTIHEAMGTPWWTSILVFNISLRILTFPLMVAAQKGSAKMMMFNHNLLHAKKLQEAAMKASSQEEHNRLFQAFRNEYNAQVAKHGDPVKTALVVPGVMLLNGGIFLSIFNAISKLMAAKVPSLTTGGTLWFSDLTECDPYFGLPIMCTLVTLAMVEYGINLAGDAGPMAMDKQQATKGLKWVLRVFAFMFIPAGNYVAAGTAVLWVSNTAFGVVQGLTLRNDKFRKRVGLPTMEALREMNAKVAAANAAATPAAAAAASKSADPGPAVATPLMANNPLSKARR